MIILPPCWVLPWNFAECSNIFLGTSVSNLVLLTHRKSPDIEKNPNGGFFDFRISVQSLIKVNYKNSRTSEDIEMKPGPVTKLGKRNKTKSKEFDDDIMSGQIETSFSFFQFMANFEQSKSWIPDT